jgi:hypothetical protein
VRIPWPGAVRFRGGPRGGLRAPTWQGESSEKPKGREGERPKEAKPTRARVPLHRRNPRAATPTGKGMKPLKRGR